MPLTVPALLADRVRASGRDTYLITPTGRLTYEQADAQSADIARLLLGAGIGKGSRVGLFFPNGIEWIIWWLALSRIGALVVPLSTLYAPAEIAKVLRLADIAMLIAPAADFTERLMWPGFSPEQQARLMAEGRLELPSAYSPEPNVITREMIEDGRRNLVLNDYFPFDGRIWILAGAEDPDVPLDHVYALMNKLQALETRSVVIADGDHRLSRPQDLEQLIKMAEDVRKTLAR